ncbi:MAG: molybdopterin-dependent oxidoreductase [Chloroflexi bacterium]|nr:molybdopterin-dependent oxidoreductase [Chloroflexota bacterium]
MSIKLSRRNFLKTTAAFATLFAGSHAFLGQPDGVAAASKDQVPRLIPTVCGMCEARCGVLAYTQGQKLLKLEGNFRHSHSLGKICPRGVAGAKFLDDADRLKSPLKRVGNRFEPISWDVALTEIGAQLSQIKQRLGAQGLAWLRHPEISDAWDVQFMRAFGSPNLFATTSLGRASRNAAAQLTVGDVPVFDFAHSRYILIFGRNHAESIFTADITRLAEAKERGAHLVVFDPRLSNTAALAQEWISLKPGTDGALLHALMNVLVTEKLYDAAFVEKYTVGFAQLADYVLDKTPGWASHITDVPADTIRRIARELASQRPACGVDPSWHGAWGSLYGNSLQTARAALCVNALLGSYGAIGGLQFSPKPNLAALPFKALPPVTAKRVDGVGDGRFPLGSPTEGVPQLLPEIIISGKPYPVGALIVNHANPARSLPNTQKAEQALRKLELLVVIDVQMSETAELAHYILPESSFLERDDPLAISARLVPEVALRQAVVKPRHDTRPAHEIIAGLAKSVGLESAFGFTARQSVEAQVKPTTESLTALDNDGVWQEDYKPVNGVARFATPSGKVELVSDTLKKAGFDPLPAYEPPLAEPGLHDFRLLTGHEFAHTGTSTQNNRYLAALCDENQLWIHPARAARLGIENGSWVVVKSATDQVRVKAVLTEGIHPEAVWLAHGYGHGTRGQTRAFAKGANDNILTADRAEPMAGGAVLGETIVTVGRG